MLSHTFFLLHTLGLDDQVLTSNTERLPPHPFIHSVSTYCMQKHHAGPSGGRDIKKNDIHALPRKTN